MAAPPPPVAPPLPGAKGKKVAQFTFPIAYNLGDPKDADFFPDTITAKEAQEMLLRTKLQIDVMQEDFLRQIHTATVDNLPEKYENDGAISYYLQQDPTVGTLNPWTALAMEAISTTKMHPVIYFQHLMRVWGEASICIMLGQGDLLRNHLHKSWPLPNTLVDSPADVTLKQHVLARVWPEFVQQAIEKRIWIKTQAPEPFALREMLMQIMVTGDPKNKMFNNAFNWNDKYGNLGNIKIADMERTEFYNNFDNLKTYLAFNCAIPRSLFLMLPPIEIDKHVTKQYEDNVSLNKLLVIPPVCRLPNKKPFPYSSVFVQARTMDGRIRINAKRLAAGKSLLSMIPQATVEAQNQVKKLEEFITEELKKAYENDAQIYSTDIKKKYRDYIAATMTKMRDLDKTTMYSAEDPTASWSTRAMQLKPLVYEAGDTYGLEPQEVKFILKVKKWNDKAALTTAQLSHLKIVNRDPAMEHPDKDVIEISQTDNDHWIDDYVAGVQAADSAEKSRVKAITDEQEAIIKEVEERDQREKDRREKIKAKQSEIMNFLWDAAGKTPDKLWYDPNYGCIPRSKDDTDQTAIKLTDWYNMLSQDDCMLWMYMSQTDDKPLNQIYQIIDIEKVLADLTYTEPTMGMYTKKLYWLKEEPTESYVVALMKLVDNQTSYNDIPLMEMKPTEIWDSLVRTEIVAGHYERFLDASGNIVKNAAETLPAPPYDIEALMARDPAVPEDDVRELFKIIYLEWHRRETSITELEKSIKKILDDHWRPLLQTHLVTSPHDPTLLPVDPRDGQRFLATKDGNGWTSDKIYMYEAASQTYKEYTKENDEIYKNKFTAFLIAHKAVREATTFDIDDQMLRRWHAEDVANAAMEIHNTKVDDPPNFKPKASRLITIAGKDYIHIVLPQYAMVAQDMLFQKEREKILAVKSAGELLQDMQKQNTDADTDVTSYGEDIHVSVENLAILRKLALGKEVDFAQAELLGGLTDPSVLTRVLANTPSICGNTAKVTEIFRSLVGRDPTSSELSSANCGSGGSGSGSGGGGFGMGGFGFGMGMGGYGMGGYGYGLGLSPMISYPGKRASARGKDRLKKSFNDIWAYLRDYPALATKMWTGRSKKDSPTAARLHKNMNQLMRVVGGEKRPLAQILDPEETSVIGYLDDEGRAVPAPLLPIVPNIPVARSNSLRKYNTLQRKAVDFATEYSYIRNKYAKKK